MLRHLQKKFYDLTRSKHQQHEQWFLRFAFTDNPLKWRDLQFFEIHPPKNVIYADPFVAKHQDKTFIIFEIDNHQSPHGYLGACEIFADGTHSEVQTILNCEYHLSYPFIFNYNNQWFMIPETSANKTIELWQAVHFPYQWQKKQVLIDNIEAVDSTLYQHNGLFYLLTSTKQNTKKFGNRLDIFYSDDLLTGQWQAHQHNPVKNNLLYERPAGNIFAFEQKIYRPVQDSIKRYGGAMELRQITQLSTNDYQEICVDKINPQTFSCIGTHTFSFDDGVLVMDALHLV